MGFLTKEQILAAQDRKTETVNVPEWGGDVRVMGLTGEARDAYEQRMFSLSGKGEVQAKEQKNRRAFLCSLCMVDAQDLPMFGEKEVGVLGLRSAIALDKVHAACMRTSGMNVEAADEAEKP